MLLAEGLISGILIGCVFALIGVGMSIVYGVMRVVNFAHGDFLVFASFITFWLNQQFHMDPISAMIIVLPLYFGLGLVIYLLIIPRLNKSEDPETASFLAFFAVSFILIYLMNLIFGATPRGIAFPYENMFSQSISIGDLYLSTSRLIATFVSIVIIALLVLFMYKTHYGRAIRSVIQNREAAKILGVNTNRVSAISFGLGFLIVGVAGVLITLVFPSIAFKLGVNYTKTAFIVIVLGGIRQPLGALFGGIVVGLLETFTALLMPVTISNIITFGVLILIIMFKPEGLLSGLKLRRKKSHVSLISSKTSFL